MNNNRTPRPEGEQLAKEGQDFLRSLKFFSLVPEQSRDRLIEELEPVTLEPGESVIRQNEPGDAVYFIEQGSCDIIVEKSDGRRFTVARRQAGEMVGEMALLTDEPRQAHVVAASELKLWKLARDRFVSLVQENRDLQEFLTTMISSRLESASHTADRTIGRYRIEHKLGHGAWAIVYQGRHTVLGKRVAIKMLKHQMAMDKEFHERFVREATIIAEMQHPNIITVFDVEERFNTIFIIMEYLEGTPLDVVLRENGPLPVAQVVDIFRQVCGGLAYAHERGIVHQDIKPDNLFLMPGGRVKILDFGLACPAGSENMEMEGTIQYMSPEQIESYPVDARTDIYCLGITAFELLTGRQPYPGDDIGELMQMHLTREIPDPAEFRDDVPEQLAACIRRCCRRDHRERYQSALEARQALDGLAGGCQEHGLDRAAKKMRCLYLFFDQEQSATADELLEEFSQRARERNIRLRLVEFDDELG